MGNDNCVHFEGRVLQIPADRHNCHYVKVKVRVLRSPDGALAVCHGPRKHRQLRCARPTHRAAQGSRITISGLRRNVRLRYAPVDLRAHRRKRTTCLLQHRTNHFAPNTR